MSTETTQGYLPDSSNILQGQQFRRRRLRGACDACRTKKTKCDSALKPGKVCTNCIMSSTICTHDMPRRQKEKQLKEMTAAYVEILETRIKKLETYIQKMHPGEDIDRIIEAGRNDKCPELRMPSNTSQVAVPRTTRFLYSTNLRFVEPGIDDASTTDDDSVESDTEDLALAALTENMKKFTTSTAAAIDERFYGQGSMFMFAKQVTDVRNEVTGEMHGIHPGHTNQFRRRIYWDLEPWESAYISTPEPPYTYPEVDLLNNLVSLYFDRCNILLPVLHRPTFVKSLSIGQHLWDPLFGMTVLLVCALGAKYSQDLRVMMFNDSSGTGISAGWHYFSQVQVYRKRMLHKSTTYDLQYYALAALYLSSTSLPQASWTLLAIGLRHAFEKGVHRRRGPQQKPSVEYELQKRAFWALVCLDSAESSFVGRACSIPLEAYDLDYPIECDDEYWDTGDRETCFRQPEGKPCSISAFVALIKLCEILGFVLRTLYSNKKTRILSGFLGSRWEGRMVAELDSTMNKWKESLPSHLHWDSGERNEVFFHQSVILHATYSYVQIQIHRPYLLAKGSPLTAPSFAICSNAARTCSGILEAAVIRDVGVLPITIIAAYTSGMVITLGIWMTQSAGTTDGFRAEKDNLEKCVQYLRKCEKRWHSGGRLGDILSEASAEMHQNRPSINHLQTSSQISPSDIRKDAACSSGSAAIDSLQLQTHFVPGTQSTFSPDDWGFQNLLLTEMGLSMELPSDRQHSIMSASWAEQAGRETYIPEHTISGIGVNDITQFTSQIGDLIGSGYDILSTPVPPVFEEWDNYYRGYQP
ncbi:ABC-transporter-regulating transcription factor [Psilocybe cubensis]|uniref:Zn(2)-C6 fungal-type domain-containing protein n=2 Tax=Psilocybe cubensis TaxID=181762 RepID=A0A8H7XJB7_PSICU|nr:ABC-transporter-regulating transcription factor [Psilocybe cubensis]KAH9481989.1 ABC-transporter-regulating transcription factor [Psilocybe cubensis]